MCIAKLDVSSSFYCVTRLTKCIISLWLSGPFVGLQFGSNCSSSAYYSVDSELLGSWSGRLILIFQKTKIRRVLILST